MNKTLEKAKDILYDYIDYVLILIVVLLVGALIGWRLDLLFGDNDLTDEKDSDVKVEEPVDDNKEEAPDKDSKNEDNEEKDDTDEDSNKDSETEDSSSEDNDNGQAKEEISVEIPQGSLPHNTAQILLDKGVIQDKNEFLTRASELELDTKLRSGTFTFIKNSELDTVIKLLANIK